MRIVAVIPARGGSKRIPRKNVRPFAGRPIIAWSIEVALRSEIFDRVIVTTDDEGIAQVATTWGAEVPFMRPSDLADDHTMTIDVMRHAIESLGHVADAYACIYPTAPLLQVSTLTRARRLLVDIEQGYIFAATRFGYPVQRAFYIGDNGQSRMLAPENYFVRSQDLQSVFHDAGQFYLGSRTTWAECDRFFDPGFPIVLSNLEVQDIDDEEDWALAEQKFLRLRS